MNKITPSKLGYRMPAEWELQEALWLALPHNEDTWPEMISKVENSYVQFIKAIHKGQKVKILVNNQDLELRFKEKLSKAGIGLSQIIFYQIKNHDSWIRDYGPVFVINDQEKQIGIVKWTFNAWGGKYDNYDSKLDNNVTYRINKIMNLPIFQPGIVLEGGSIEVNGSGTLVTTEQCLLNKNRNPELKKDEIEQYLKDYLNVSNILWLKNGIAGDDTDGHIDDITRFVNQNTVVCSFEEDKNDENYGILQENYKLLTQMKDESGNKLKIVKLPMPGFVGDNERRYPASYANFYIGNDVVVVPIFRHKNDAKSLEILQKLFPTRKVIGVNCKEMIYGYGSLHCVSQQEPSVS